MQGEGFFRCGGHNANRCGIIQAHKGEQAFGIGLVAVAVDDNDLAAFFGGLVKTLALGKAADAEIPAGIGPVKQPTCRESYQGGLF